ncbi:hypothetical protein HYV21_01310 [Candidatus Microgenomates bacterium]|nr:hypothetical protein [Candidatus Microgenomates bacterium]
MQPQESGRRHLSSEILSVVDNVLPYERMKIGQTLRIWAQDARTKQSTFFNIVVLSIRDLEDKQKEATFEYVQGDFSFYDGENPQRTIKLEPGTLMENGVSATLIPQQDMRMAYVGGIGKGRDHSFEFVNGTNQTIIAQAIEGIEVTEPSKYFQQPDITAHLNKIEATKNKQTQEQQQAIEESNNAVNSVLEQTFKEHPRLQQIREMVERFSPNGKIAILSYLMYAQEDGVFEKAWNLLQEAWNEHYQYQHPRIRGDADILATNRDMLMRITGEAGIQWPRSYKNAEDDIDYSLPLQENRALRERLERKLDEYKGRLTNPRMESDARHKIAVLEKLLNTGNADAIELRSELQQYPWFNEESFDRAVAVIEDYRITGGKNIGGGTGLK